MSKWLKLEKSLSFNYFSLVVGVLTFLGYYFLRDINIMMSWLMTICLIIVEITNVGRIKIKSRPRIYVEKFINIKKNL